MARKPIAPKIIIAGAPAAGKGTQCEIIKKELGVIHLSTGDMLRAAVKDGTELGVKAKEFMDAGQLVPDDLIINVVVERLQQPDCQSKGWLLDGFPRTRAQADAIAALGIVADSFILLDGGITSHVQENLMSKNSKPRVIHSSESRGRRKRR